MSELEAKLRDAADAIAARDKPFLPADDMSLMTARQLLLESGADTHIDLTVKNYPGVSNRSRFDADGTVSWSIYVCDNCGERPVFSAPRLDAAVHAALASIAAERACPPADPLAAAQAALEPATVAAAPGF